MTPYFLVLVDQAGWKDYRTFLARFRRAAEEEAAESGEPGIARLTVSERTYERWRAGQHMPQNDARRVLVRLFGGIPIAEMFADASTTRVLAPQEPGPNVCDSAPHTEHRVGQDAALSWMERHQAMAARRAIEFALGAEHPGIGAETMSYLQDEIHRIAGIYNRVPLSMVLDDLAELQDRTFRLIEGGRAKPTQIRDLYLIAAIGSGLLAKASHDLGDPQSAMMQARSAAICAAQADHPGMIAWVDGLKSLIAYWANRPEDALHYARHGANAAVGGTGTVAIWLASLEGRAAAILGDKKTVAATAVRAHRLRDAAQPDLLDELGGLFHFPQVRQAYYEVEALVLVGSTGPAVIAQALDAVQGFSDHDNPHWAFGDQAGTQTHLALAYLQGGDLDGAVGAVRPVLELSADHRNAGIIASVERVRAALMQDTLRNAASAKDLREEIADFSRRRPLALPR
jgi:hypothetical protein